MPIILGQREELLAVFGWFWSMFGGGVITICTGSAIVLDQWSQKHFILSILSFSLSCVDWFIQPEYLSSGPHVDIHSKRLIDTPQVRHPQGWNQSRLTHGTNQGLLRSIKTKKNELSVDYLDPMWERPINRDEITWAMIFPSVHTTTPVGGIRLNLGWVSFRMHSISLEI